MRGSYGFVPTLNGGRATVTVALWDLNRTPNKEMASVEVPVGGTAVRSETDPQFTVRVVRVDVK